jgi:hypothetical protein
MNEKNPDPAKTSTKLSLAELLARSMEDDELVEETKSRSAGTMTRAASAAEQVEASCPVPSSGEGAPGARLCFWLRYLWAHER